MNAQSPTVEWSSAGVQLLHVDDAKAAAAVARTLWRAEEDCRSPSPAVAQPLWRGEPGGGSGGPFSHRRVDTEWGRRGDPDLGPSGQAGMAD